MRRKILTTTILVLGLVAMVTIAAAQESQVIHFQGLLTGPDGGPLRTDIYDVNFSIWDQQSGGVEPEWSEIQVIEVTNGLFDVFLGSQIPLSADVFTHAEGDSELRYLEIQVADDDPMTPRTQIAKTPNSFVSSRVLGDVVTGPGSFRMAHPPEGPAVEMIVDDISNSINFRLVHPPEQPAVEILSDAGSSRISFRMAHPPEGPDPMPAIEMDVDAARTSFRLMDPGDDKVGFDVFTGGEGNSIKLMDPGDDGVSVAEITADAAQTSFKMMDPVDDKVGFDVFTGGEGNSIKLMDPGDDGVPVAEIAADAAQTSFKLIDPGDDEIGFDVFIGGEGNSIKMMDPGDDGIPAMQMTSDDISNGMVIFWTEPIDNQAMPVISMDADGLNNSINFRMVHPPEGPDVIPAIEMTTGESEQGSQASFRMFNPQPEPPAEPLLEMSSTQYGANFAMAAPGVGGLRNEIINPMFEVNVDAEGAGLNMNDEIGKYMGFEPSPFYDGGLLKMFNPVTDNTMVSLGSDGAIQARKATFGSSSNDGSYNLVVGMGNQASGDYNFVGGYQAQSEYNNCFLWADYSTYQPLASSAANQFKVRSSGGIFLYTSGDMSSGVYLEPGASIWTPISAPPRILNTRPVDGQEILNKIERLPIKHYSNKGQDNGIEHIGPMARDFNSLFGLGQDDEHISMLDPSGVALAGVQALLDKIEKLEARIAELEAERR